MAIEATQRVDGARPADGTGATQIARSGPGDPADQFSEKLKRAGADGHIDDDERTALKAAFKDMDNAAREQTFRQVVSDRGNGASGDRAELQAFYEMLPDYQQFHFAETIAKHATSREQVTVIEALAPLAGNDKDGPAAAAIGHILLDVPRTHVRDAPQAHVRDAVAALHQEGVLEAIFAAAATPEFSEGYTVQPGPVLTQRDFDDLVRTMALATNDGQSNNLHSAVFESATQVFNNHTGRFDGGDKVDAMGALHGMLMSHDGAALDRATGLVFDNDSVQDLFEVMVKELDDNGRVGQSSGLMIGSALVQRREPVDAFANALVAAAEAGDGAKVDALQNAYARETGASEEEIAAELEAAGADPAFASIASDVEKLKHLQDMLLGAAGSAAEDRGNVSAQAVNVVGSLIYGATALLPAGKSGGISPFLADGASDFIRGLFSPESGNALGKVPKGEGWQPESFLEIVQTLGQPHLQRDDGTNVPIAEGEIDAPAADPEAGTQPAEIAERIISDMRHLFYHQHAGKSL